MKLLICTQKVDRNDDILGFFHGWIAEFARHCEMVTVICLYKGEYELPENVRVLSLGKEVSEVRSQKLSHYAKASRDKEVRRIIYLVRFFKYIWQERMNYDSIFVHMTPIYVLLGGLLWRVWNKKIGLWFAHGHVPMQLRIAEKITDCIFTSTDKGCRLDSNKIKIVGQGIDVQNFIPITEIINHKSEIINLITIGRISPVKDIETLIKAVEVIKNKLINIKLQIIGDIGLSSQKAYLDLLKGLIRARILEGNIEFVGSVPNKDIKKYLEQSDIFVSAGTGGLDKALLEAMAAGLPVIGCNESLPGIFGPYANELFFKKGDFEELSGKIMKVSEMEDDKYHMMIKYLRTEVEEKHSLKGLAEKILKHYILK